MFISLRSHSEDVDVIYLEGKNENTFLVNFFLSKFALFPSRLFFAHLADQKCCVRFRILSSRRSVLESAARTELGAENRTTCQLMHALCWGGCRCMHWLCGVLKTLCLSVLGAGARLRRLEMWRTYVEGSVLVCGIQLSVNLTALTIEQVSRPQGKTVWDLPLSSGHLARPPSARTRTPRRTSSPSSDSLH